VRSTHSATILYIASVVKRRSFLARTVSFLIAGILFLLPSRTFATVTITISPTAVNLSAKGSQQFTAAVTGASDMSVTWTIQEGVSGGTVSSGGLYSASGALGTYHVIATSNADNTQRATATVAVSGFIHSELLYSGACTATLLPDGKILYTGGQIAGLSAGPDSDSNHAEIYDPVALASVPTGNLTIPRCGETATLLPNGQVLLAGGRTQGGGTASAELYDPISGAFAPTGSMSFVRFGHTATLLPNGEVLITGGGNCNSGCVVFNTAEIYSPNSGTFRLTTSNLSTAYTGAAAILLATGKVLIAGGSSGGINLNSFAEIYDPATGTFTQTGTMVNPRQSFTATLMQNSKVLFVGGDLNSAGVTPAAEIYDPATGTFTATGNLNIPRDFHTATLLVNGKILVAGGTSTLSRPASAELYDPATGTFSLTGSLQEPRNNHTGTALPNGSVVVASGADGQLLSSIETYDPASGIFTSQSVFLKAARIGHGTTQLPDGRVLLTGGQDAYFNVNSSAEIYDPSAGAFSLTGSLNTGRYGHTATLLKNGNVLVVGGYSANGGTNLVSTAELFDTASGTFSFTGNPNVPRAYHTATLLGNGMVLIAGGEIGGNQTSTSVELYDPNSGSFNLAGNMFAPRYNHTATLLTDGRVLIAEGISGINAGFGNTVQPDEVYDPITGKFAQVGTPVLFSQNPVIPFDSVLLASGQVLVDEGTIFDPNSNTLSTFNPLTTLGTQLFDYRFLLLPNDQVFVAGGASAAYQFDTALRAYSSVGFMKYSRSSPTANLLSNGQVLIAGGASVTQAEFYLPSAVASNSASPILSLINPSSAVAGGPGFTLTVFGFNFVGSSIVNFNGVARQTTYLSATQLSILITTGDIAIAGVATITVTNPAIGTVGGGTSNPATLTFMPGNIQPVVGALSPASASAGGPSFTLGLSGNNFTTSSVVTFNGLAVPAVFSSAAELQASIPASAIAVAGTPIVTVTNPGSVPSVVVTFTVNNPVPRVSNISPTSAMPGGTGLTLDVTGTNFNASSIVVITSSNGLINGKALPTTSETSSLLHASLPASDLAQGGKLSVTVKNPIPGGGTTSALSFTVDDYAIIASTSSETVTAGQSAVFTLVVAPSDGMYSNPVTLMATAPPNDATASFSPSATITPNAASSTLTFTIATKSHAAAGPGFFSRRNRQVLLLLWLVGIALASAGFLFRASGRLVQPIVPQFVFALLLVAVAGFVACNGSVGGASAPAQVNPVPGSGTPSGTYMITVTATSGAITHSTQVTLIVM
jgi:hypothetical protein